jgi:hypothetical protein
VTVTVISLASSPWLGAAKAPVVSAHVTR